MHAEDRRPDLETKRSACSQLAVLTDQRCTNNTLGVILSGSPYSVYASDAPHVDPAVFELGVPILGICYGLQEIARTHGGNVEAHTQKEYGYAKIEVQKVGNHGDRLFEGIQMEEDGGMQVS